jgi:hypothetical protein
VSGRVHYAVSRKLAAEVEGRREWDEHPQLYRLHVKTGQPNLVPVTVPGFMWNAARPPDVLELVAELMEGRRFSPVPLGAEAELGDLYGMAFRCEAWYVETPADKSPEARSVQVMAGDHRLHQHPARVEIRMIYGVDINRVTYANTVYRGEPQAERLIAYPDGRGEGFGRRVEQQMGGDGEVQPTGAVIEALDRMVYHLTGVEPRKRASSYVGGDPQWS